MSKKVTIKVTTNRSDYADDLDFEEFNGVVVVQDVPIIATTEIDDEEIKHVHARSLGLYDCLITDD